jgi:chemotaxis protein CheD
LPVISAEIGEIVTSGQIGESVKVSALGIGVATVLHCPSRQAVGVLLIALPESSIDAKRALEKPGYFADTGIPLLLSTFRKKFALDGEIFHAKIFGGATLIQSVSTFDVGTRNVIAVKKALNRLSLIPVAEDVGGNVNRSLSIDNQTGVVTVSAPGRSVWQL